MEFLKMEPDEANNEEIEYYKPENESSFSGIKFINRSLIATSPKTKAAKKRRKRYIFSTPKRKNRRKQDGLVRADQNTESYCYEDSPSSVRKDRLSNDSSDTVILSDIGSSNQSKQSDDIELSLLANVLKRPQSFTNNTANCKPRSKNNRNTVSRSKFTKKSSVPDGSSSVLPFSPETYVASSTEMHIESCDSYSELPTYSNATPRIPSKGLPSTVSDPQLSMPIQAVRKSPVKRRKRGKGNAKKLKTTEEPANYNSIQEAIDFVVKSCSVNLDYDSQVHSPEVPVEKPLKRTARKRTGGKLPAPTARVLPSTNCNIKRTISDSSLSVVKNGDEISNLPCTTSVLPYMSNLTTGNILKSSSITSATSEELPPHVDLTFEEDVSENQNLDLSRLLSIHEKSLNVKTTPYQNLTSIGSFNVGTSLTTSQVLTSQTSDLCSKANSSCLNVCDKVPQNKSNISDSSQVSDNPSPNVLLKQPAPHITIKTEKVESHSETNPQMFTKKFMAILNIKQETAVDLAKSACSSGTRLPSNDPENLHLENPKSQTAPTATAFKNSLINVPCENRVECLSSSQKLDELATHSHAKKSLVFSASLNGSSKIIKNKQESSNKTLIQNSENHDREVCVLSVEDKKKLKEKEIEVICLDDSSSDSISFVSPESNARITASILSNENNVENDESNVKNKLNFNKVLTTSTVKDQTNDLISAKNQVFPPLLDFPSLSMSYSRITEKQPLPSNISNSIPFHFTPDKTAIYEDSSNAFTSMQQNVSLNQPKSDYNSAVVKKEIVDDLSSEIGSNAANTICPDIALPTETDDSMNPYNLSSIDSSIDNVIRNGNVTEPVIEHPLDLLQSIKKEVAFEDVNSNFSDLHGETCFENDSVRSPTPILQERNNSTSNTCISVSVTEKDHSEERGKSVVDFGNSLNPDSSSYTSELEERSYDLTNTNSDTCTLVKKNERGMLPSPFVSADENISSCKTATENISVSPNEHLYNIESDTFISDVAQRMDKISDPEINQINVESSVISSCNSINESIKNHASDQGMCLSPSYHEESQHPSSITTDKSSCPDLEFAECVTNYLASVRKASSSKQLDESCKEMTNDSTVAKENQSGVSFNQKEVLRNCNSTPSSINDTETDRACENSEQGSLDNAFSLYSSADKIKNNLDKFFMNFSPLYLLQLHDEERVKEVAEKDNLYEVFSYNDVATKLRAAAELSLKSETDEGLEEFPVVEEEIECYYRLLNVEPRLISSRAGLVNAKKEEEAMKSEFSESVDIEIKVLCEAKDETPNIFAESLTNKVEEPSKPEKVKEVEKSFPTPPIFDASQSDDEIIEVEVIEYNQDARKFEVADASKQLDSVTPIFKEILSSARSGNSSMCSTNNKSAVLVATDNLNKSSLRNVEADTEVDVELRQLACESIKGLKAVENENNEIIDISFETVLPQISEKDNILNSNLPKATNTAFDKESPETILPKTGSKDISAEEITRVGGHKSNSNEMEVEVVSHETENKSVFSQSECPIEEQHQEQISVNNDSSQIQQTYTDVNVSVTDLLNILHTAKSIPTETPSAGEVTFFQSYDYGHGIQITREKHGVREESSCNEKAEDFYSLNPPNIQFPIVREYGHKPPADVSGSCDRSATDIPDTAENELPVCGDESEDEFYTVESEYIDSAEGENEEEDRDRAETGKNEEGAQASAETEENQEAAPEKDHIDFPQYKSRYERIMERKLESRDKETELTQEKDRFPPKSFSEKQNRPVALVQPCSKTVPDLQTEPSKDIPPKPKLSSPVLDPRKKKHKKESPTKTAQKKKNSSKTKHKHKSVNVDDGSLLFTPDRAKPRRGLLPTPSPSKRIDDSESKRLYGRVSNRGGFLTESSSEPPKVKVPKKKRNHDKRKPNQRKTEEFHSMINLPIIDRIPVSRIPDKSIPRNLYREPKSSIAPDTRKESRSAADIIFGSLGLNPPKTTDNFEFFSRSSNSPLLDDPVSRCESPLPPYPRCKSPLLPDPFTPRLDTRERVPLLPSPDISIPLSFEKVLLSKPSIADPKRKWTELRHVNRLSFSHAKTPLPNKDLFDSTPSMTNSPISPATEFPADVPIPQPVPPPHKHARTRQTGCICLPPKTLKPLVGNAVFKTRNVLLLILEWNVDWLVQQQKNQDPPPISSTVHRVKNMYSCFEEYYNTYLPLVLLETWQRIYVSWTHLHQAPPYFCQVTQYEVEKHSTKVKCQVVFNFVDRDKGIFPEEGNIIMVKYATKDKGGIKILGYITEVEVNAFNLTDPDHKALARNVKSASVDHLQLLTMTYIGAYTSNDFDVSQLVRIQVLCNIKSILKQNDALLNAKASPLYENILNPLADGLRTVTMVSRHPDPHKVALNVSECVKEIIQGIVSMHPIPLLTIVKSVPSSDKLLVLPPLIQKMTDSYKTKVLFCTRTSKALADVGFNLESCSAKVAIIGKRADVHQKLRRYMLDDLAAGLLNSVRAKANKSGVPFLEDPFKGDALYKAKLDVLRESDVILTLVRYCHDDLVVQLCQDGDHVSRMCCIMDEANLCTEPEILIPLLFGMSKMILIGDPDVPSKVCSKTVAKFSFNKSLFHRAFELDAMND